jgi:transposase
MKSTTTIGLDLAKDVFQVHGVDAQQNVTLKRQLKRKDLLVLFEKLPPCLVGMEACGGAHYWSREIEARGHTVKLMVPKYVKAYVKRGKTDATDAEAICEAVTRRHVEAVAAKSVDQQCLSMLHKVRDQLVGDRTKAVNIIRAHLSELGIVAARGREGFNRLRAILCDEAYADIPRRARIALMPEVRQLDAIEKGIADIDAELRGTLKTDETSRRLETIPGIGLMGATAFAGLANEAKAYKSARHFAASLGLTPKITGSGGDVMLGSITKQGNGYLRRLLFLGAKSRLGFAKRNPGKADPKLVRLLKEKEFKVAAIALANKMARTIWALLVRGGTYSAKHLPPVFASSPARGLAM